MKIITLWMGLAISSLAAAHSFSQSADAAPPEKSVSATQQSESETSREEVHGPGRKKAVRIERRTPAGVEVEEYTDNDVVITKKPAVRKRVEIVEDGDAAATPGKRRIEVRPQVRLFPKEREIVIRGVPPRKKMRFEDAAPGDVDASKEEGKMKADEHVNEELGALRAERDTLRKELRKLKRQLEELKKSNEPAKTESDLKP